MLYIIIFVGVIVAALVKYAQKRELSGKLGRDVEDHELVSLNSWIEAEQKEDRRKGLQPEKVPIQKNEKKVEKIEKESNQVTEKQKSEEIAETPIETPTNCGNCGAVLPKEIAFCQFCGTHSSRKSLEEHVSIFLQNLDKDFELMIPASHGHLQLGCVFIPLLALVLTIFGYFLLPSAQIINAVLFGIPILSLIVAYIWLTVADNFITKKQGHLFEQNIEPKIRQFMKENDLRDIEILSIAKRKLLKENKILKHIYRRF